MSACWARRIETQMPYRVFYFLGVLPSRPVNIKALSALSIWSELKILCNRSKAILRTTPRTCFLISRHYCPNFKNFNIYTSLRWFDSDRKGQAVLHVVHLGTRHVDVQPQSLKTHARARACLSSLHHLISSSHCRARLVSFHVASPTLSLILFLL